MLTGELPIGRFEPPSKKARIDIRLDEVVLRTLESTPERRYQHASDVKTDVESIVGDGATEFPAVTSDSADLESSVRSRLKVPAAGLLVAGSVNLLVTLLIALTLAFTLVTGDATRTIRGATIASLLFIVVALPVWCSAAFWSSARRECGDLQSYRVPLSAAMVAILPSRLDSRSASPSAFGR